MSAPTGTIALLPLDDIEAFVLKYLTVVLNRTFPFQFVVNPPEGFHAVVPPPLYGGRCHSTQVLKVLSPLAPADALKSLALSERDLYSPIFTAYFGEALLGGCCALVSLHRLRQEYYDLAPDRALFLSRCEKVATHEVAHTFGLVHCRDKNCIMYSAHSIVEVDARSSCFCPDCAVALRSKIQAAKNAKGRQEKKKEGHSK
jgi:archaemetzincin